MAAGVLIDTSFLITLADKNRQHHDAARRYWRHFLDNGLPVYLSAIVVSEFCVKQEITPEMLRRFVVLPFNWDDAIRAAKLFNFPRPDTSGVPRTLLRDDLKIIAQAAVADAEFAITDDSETFYRYCEAFRDAGEVQLKCIKLEDGFDSALFDANGQSSFLDSLDQKEELDP